MRKKISLGAALTFMAITAAVTFSITMVVSMTNFNSMVYNLRERETMYNKLSELEKEVRQNYYGTIDEDVLMESIARGFINGIGDDYAAYYTADQYKAIKTKYDGKTVDIGAKLEKDPSGYLVITEIYADSPAETRELAVGDLIIKVDELDVTPETADEALEMMKGEAGTSVKIVVRRESEDTEFTIARREINVPSVYWKMIDTNAYIRILVFNDNTADQFAKAIDEAKLAGATGLIFDVRGNEGGSLSAAVKMLDSLLPDGNLVSYTANDGTTKILAKSDSKCIDMPMLVLTDGKTASAAEIFVQALRDFGVGKSVGTKTLGKGSMQEEIKLNDGSAISITTARYNSPAGVTFDGVGLQPDYDVKLIADYEAMLGTLTIDEIIPDIDAQLKKAIEVIETFKKDLGGAGNTSSTPSQSEASSEQPSSEDTSSDESSEASSDESSEASSEE